MIVKGNAVSESNTNRSSAGAGVGFNPLERVCGEAAG